MDLRGDVPEFIQHTGNTKLLYDEVEIPGMDRATPPTQRIFHLKQIEWSLGHPTLWRQMQFHQFTGQQCIIELSRGHFMEMLQNESHELVAPDTLHFASSRATGATVVTNRSQLFSSERQRQSTRQSLGGHDVLLNKLDLRAV